MLRALSIDVAAFFFDPNMFPADVVMNHFDWVRTFGATRIGGLVDVYTSCNMSVMTLGRLHPDPAQAKDIAAARQLWFVMNSIVSGMDRPSESPTGEERPIRSRKWRNCSSSAPGASRTIV